jgi:hypothetical protein
MRLTRAVTPMRRCAATTAKVAALDALVAALDALAAADTALSQPYVTHFCAEAEPKGFSDPCVPSPLAHRWQRVAIQQAAGIARSWRTTHQRAQEDCADHFAAWLEEEQAPEEAPPPWKPWRTPTLRKAVIQATATVALLHPGQGTSVAFWLRVSTRETGQPLFLPVTLSAYHQRCLAGKQVDSGVTLIKKADGWWRTVTYEEEIPLQTSSAAPVVGVDVGITHFLTTATGKHDGSFQGQLAKRHQRDREQRRRKAKLRDCLKKTGVERLPSTRNPKLARTVRQEINRAVNELYRDQGGRQIAFERLSVATMRFKARRMNAHERLSLRLESGAPPCATGLGRGQAWGRSHAGHERLHLTRMPALSFCVQEQPPRTANVLLWGLWLADARRPQCRGQHRRATRRQRDPVL